jgi:hypothetical protein
MDPRQAGAQLTGGRSNGRVDVDVGWNLGSAALVRSHQPVKVSLRPPSVSRSVSQHQLN